MKKPVELKKQPKAKIKKASTEIKVSRNIKSKQVKDNPKKISPVKEKTLVKKIDKAISKPSTENTKKIPVIKEKTLVKKVNQPKKSIVKKEVKNKTITLAVKAKEKTGLKPDYSLAQKIQKEEGERLHKLYHHVWPSDDSSIEENGLIVIKPKAKQLAVKKLPDANKTLINSLVNSSLNIVKNQAKVMETLGKHVKTEELGPSKDKEISNINKSLNNINKKALNTIKIMESMSLKDMYLKAEEQYEWYREFLTKVNNNKILNDNGKVKNIT